VALAGSILIACAQLLVSSASTAEVEVLAGSRTPWQSITAPTRALEDTPHTAAAVLPGLQSLPIPGRYSPSSAASDPRATIPAAVPGLIDSASASVSEIEAAPEEGLIAGDARVKPESLAPQVIDSSGKKALKGILRTISGSPAAKAKSRKP
jgi:hypothetical protein